MTFDITKDFSFSAGHRLTGLPEGHKCARVHGHGYLVRVRVLAPRITDPGWVLDYGDLAPFGAYLDSVFDHQWLGAGALFDDVGGGKTLPVLYTELAADPSAGSTGISSNPTAENLAAWFRWWLTTPGNLPALAPVMAPPGSYVRPVSVEAGVSETPKTWAWAR